MISLKPAAVLLLIVSISVCSATENKEKPANVQPEEQILNVKPGEQQVDVKPEVKPVEVKKEEHHADVHPEAHKNSVQPEIHNENIAVSVEPEVSSTPQPAVTEEEVVVEDEPPKPSGNSAESGRQFMPMYQPMFPPPSGGFNMIRRQFGGGMELLGDIVMMGMIGLPILGLLTVGSSSIANFLGFGSSSSSKSSSKRNKRSLKEKAAGAVEYAKTLWDVMEQLERAFEKYDLYQAECRLRAVCEVHHKTPRMGAWGQTILDLMRKQKELQSREILPVSRFLFSNYDDAARAGSRGEDCGQLYQECSHHLSYYISDKENEVENEIEVKK